MSRLVCPVCPMKDLYSKKWLHQIVMVLNGTENLRFGELKHLLNDMNPKTLTQRLRDLEEHGIISRTVYQEGPIRVEYALTDKGADFEDAVKRMCEWVARWYLVEET